MITASEYRDYTGTVLFFVIPDIKEMDSGLAFSALAQLHGTLRNSALLLGTSTQWIGSTISGLYVIVPDEAHIPVHSLLPMIFESLCKAGVPIRCGVAWGSCLCFRDADDELNFVGRPINLAARLAYSRENPACLISADSERFDDGYVHISSVLDLNSAPKRMIRGKTHDAAGFLCRVLDENVLQTLDTPKPPEVHGHGQSPEYSSGVILAYDLPKFSAGDDSQLSKRVRSVVNAIRELKENHSACREASIYFCPGGDGGIMVLSNVRQEASELAVTLAAKLVVESEYKDTHIAVDARIGVHYGPVTLYRDAAGRLRPTGPSCFIADDLIADADSRASGLVYSDSLRSVISHGSERFLKSEFDELPTLQSGPAAGLARYVPKPRTGAPLTHPLVRQLFGPLSSWQPDDE